VVVVVSVLEPTELVELVVVVTEPLAQLLEAEQLILAVVVERQQLMVMVVLVVVLVVPVLLFLDIHLNLQLQSELD
jgi:hypothetical protein